MMIRNILFVVLCLMGSASFAQQVNWYLPPIVDSVTEENLSKDNFIFYSNGKRGLYYYRAVEVPANYDEIINLDEGFYHIKNKKKWGLYSLYSKEEILACLYDTIIKANYPIFKVIKGNSCAYYNLRYEKWETSFSINCKLPKTQEEEFMSDSIARPMEYMADDVRESDDVNKEYAAPYEALKKIYQGQLINILSKISKDLYIVSIKKRYGSDIFQLSTNTIILDSISSAPHTNKTHRLCFRNGNVHVLEISSGKIIGHFNKLTPFPPPTTSYNKPLS